jgi:hypothetical protein
MKHRVLLITTAALAMISGSAFAAVVTWQPVQSTAGPTDVLNNGVAHAATVFGQTPAGTVNGVNFTTAGYAGTGISTNNGNFQFIGSDVGVSPSIQLFTFGAGAEGSISRGSDPGYNSLVNQRAFAFIGSGQPANEQFVSLSLFNLTPGTPYQIQVWSSNVGADNRSIRIATGTVTNPTGIEPDYQLTETGSSSTLDSTVSQFVVGSFTATGTSQALFVVPGAGNDGAYMSIAAASVRVVPEPGTATALLALAGSILGRRNRARVG